MGLFDRKVPNTITDQQYADLNRRAQKVPMFTDEAIRRRLAAQAQQRKADQS